MHLENRSISQAIICYLWINQLTFTSSKSTIETLEKGVKYVQTFDVTDIGLVFLLLTLNKFHTTVSIINFEQVVVSLEEFVEGNQETL